MTFGPHGVSSLTPIFLFSLYGAYRLMIRRDPLRVTACLTAVLAIAMLAFGTWSHGARNHGGSAQELHRLF